VLYIHAVFITSLICSRHKFVDPFNIHLISKLTTDNTFSDEYFSQSAIVYST
jgi:hypothetical protein